MGDSLRTEPVFFNPKGLFEDRAINDINETLLDRAVRHYRRNVFNRVFRRAQIRMIRVHYFQRPMIPLPLSVRPACDQDLADRIRALTVHRPYCFKDPRFSYTLGAWRPFLGDTTMVCVFRDPAVTATSIVKACDDAGSFASNLEMNFQKALRIWEQVYRHILEIHHPQGGRWLFLHYDQIMRAEGRRRLEAALEVKVDDAFADENLRRSRPGGPVPERIGALYRRLCDLAGYAA
jgi:hypothetical protein